MIDASDTQPRLEELELPEEPVFSLEEDWEIISNPETRENVSDATCLRIAKVWRLYYDGRYFHDPRKIQELYHLAKRCGLPWRVIKEHFGWLPLQRRQHLGALLAELGEDVV